MFRSTGTGARPRSRPSVYKLLGLCGVVAGVAMAAAAPASAAPCTPNPAAGCVPLTFNWAVLNTPSTPNTVVVSPSGSPITAVAQIVPASATTANFSVDPSQWSFPTYHFDISGVTGTIDVALKNPGAQGTINAANGAMSMTADLISSITPTGGSTCTVDSGTLNFSTGTTQPLAGVAFPTGSLANFATGAGAFGVGWSSLPNGTPASACALVDAALGGPGGMWISRDINPINLALTAKRIKTVKSGKTAVLHATITDTGASSGALKACVKAPRRFKVKHACQTIANVIGGTSAHLSYPVKTPKHKHGTYKLTMTVTGTNASVTKTFKFKVRK